MSIERETAPFIQRRSVSIPELPEDIFLLILKYLEAWDMVRCRRLSQSWRTVFSKMEYLCVMLKKYPLAREVRELSSQRRLNSHQEDSTDWQGILDRVASRYFHLTQGKARSVTRYKLAASEQYSHWYPVSQWDYHESQPGGRLYYENATHISRLGGKPYLFRSTFWTYDDGLLVFAPGDASDSTINYASRRNDSASSALVVLDIETGAIFPVPFSTDGRVMRNIRLKEFTLVIEWAERDAFHDLNESEKVHRHFVSCFDIKLTPQWGRKLQSPATWTVSFRSEWKMHFLGLPLNQRDRFFSTHNHTHYAVYFWQPNRSMYTGDEELPIESLLVWDISRPCPYVPSTDPAGKYRPKDAEMGPHVLSRFSFHALDFLGVRQHMNIVLMSLSIDSPTLSLTIRENACIAGQGYFDPAERLWCAKSTFFPFVGCGPHLRREWDGNLPPYRGHCSMESADVEESERWFVPVMDVVDPKADVRFSVVETCFTGLSQLVNNEVLVRIKALGSTVAMDGNFAREICGMGRIAGDERWVIGQNAGMELVVLKF